MPRPPLPFSLIKRMRVTLFGAATLFYVVATSCLFFGNHYLIEQNIEKQARQLLPVFGELSAPLFVAADKNTIQLIAKTALMISDIGLVRIYDKQRTRLLTEYRKPGLLPLAPLEANAVIPMENGTLRVERAMGIAHSLQLFAPVKISSQAVDGDSIAGYVEIGMDFTPSRNSLYPGMLITMAILALLLLIFLLIYTRKIQVILKSPLNFRVPSQRMAKETFAAPTQKNTLDTEINAIHRALHTTISSIKEQERKRSDASHVATTADDMQNRAKNDSLMASLSHEIHTPMNGLIGMLDLLLKSNLTAAQREFTEMAHTSAESLLRRLNDMLDYAGIDQGKLALEYVSFDLLQEMDAIASELTPIAHGKGLNLIVHYPPAVEHHLIGNPERIRQVLRRLLGNAIQYTDQGQVLLDLKMAEQDGYCHVRISVTDSGIGMESEQIADIFDHQNSPGDPIDTTRNVEDSHEPGLRRCKKLVELMGGRMGVHSQPEIGSTIWFSLYLRPAPRSAMIEAARTLGSVRVLLVDHDNVRRRTTEQQLRQQALRADGFASVATAMTALNRAVTTQDPYRIAILDAEMPDIDDGALGVTLKADPSHKNMLLVMLSTHTDAQHLQRYAQAGFSACLGKPLMPQILIDTMEALCASLKSGKVPPFLTATSLYTASLEQSNEAQFFAGYRVLVADDNRVNQQVAIHLLRKLGCHAEIAANGHEAVAMHAKQPYDLILMDCQMPQMNGFQATAAIRATEMDIRTPIIALTAYTMQGQREKCLVAGMDDFLTKPIRPRKLCDTLGRWLQASTAATAEQYDELAAMQQMFGADFVELATLFCNDSPRRITELRRAATERMASQVAAAAHSLSGSSASIGATGLAALCKELEIQAKAGQLDSVEAVLHNIETEYARIDAKLQAMVQSP